MKVTAGTKFFIKLMYKMNVLKNLNVFPKLRFGNKSIKLPILSGLGYENLFPHETWLNSIVSKLLPLKEGVFIDVGMNIGQTLLKFLEQESDKLYFGFEPNPTCYHYVEKIKEINQSIENIHVIPVGLSNESRILKLRLNNDSDSAASLAEDFRAKEEYSTSRWVVVMRGDEVVEMLGISQIAVLKIDVEGGEWDVINGLQQTIKKMRPFIVCEILPVYDMASSKGQFRRQRIDRILNFLSQEKYKLFRLMHDGTTRPLETIESHGDLNLCEYLFVPEEHLHHLDATFIQ